MGHAGRPKEENPRDQKITIRLTKYEREELMNYTEEHNQTITQVVSDALSLLYEKSEKQ